MKQKNSEMIFFFEFFFCREDRTRTYNMIYHFAEIFAVCSFYKEHLHKTSVLPIELLPVDGGEI